MKPINLFCVLFLFCVWGLVSTPALFADNPQPWDVQEDERNAQEEVTNDEKNAQEEMGSSVYGRITSIDMNDRALSLISTDQVEDKDEEEDDAIAPADYRFKSNTPLIGLASLSELSVGDFVTLDYYAFGDENRITQIDFDKHGESQSDPEEVKQNTPGILVD